MADPFFPFLSYGESALEDILQLWDEDGSTSPDALDASQQMVLLLISTYLNAQPLTKFTPGRIVLR